LNSFLDGALDEQRHHDFEAHLAQCADCRKAIEAASELKKLMHTNMPAEDQIPEMWPAIKDKLPPLCAAVQTDLSAYFDGELTSQAEAAVSSHILQCSACTDLLEDIRVTGRLLATSFVVPVSINIDLWPQLKPRLGEDCAMVAAELSAYSDTELDPIRHRAITAHLTDCSTCSVEFLRMTRLGETLRSTYLPPASNVDLWPDIDNKLKVIPFRKQSRYEKLKNLIPFPNMKERQAIIAVASVVTFVGVGVTALFAVSQRDNVKQVSAESYLLDSLLSDMSNSAEAVVYEDHG
jgi:predicted anti-sigma-YlaC factor YlaD